MPCNVDTVWDYKWSVIVENNALLNKIMQSNLAELLCVCVCVCVWVCVCETFGCVQENLLKKTETL